MEEQYVGLLQVIQIAEFELVCVSSQLHIHTSAHSTQYCINSPYADSFNLTAVLCLHYSQSHGSHYLTTSQNDSLQMLLFTCTICFVL